MVLFSRCPLIASSSRTCAARRWSPPPSIPTGRPRRQKAPGNSGQRKLEAWTCWALVLPEKLKHPAVPGPGQKELLAQTGAGRSIRLVVIASVEDGGISRLQFSLLNSLWLWRETEWQTGHCFEASWKIAMRVFCEKNASFHGFLVEMISLCSLHGPTNVRLI